MRHTVAGAIRLGNTPGTSGRLPTPGETVCTMAAVAMLVVSTLATQLDQGEAEVAAAAPAVHAAAADAGAATFIGSYGGLPYTHPSDLTIKQPGVHEVIVKDVGWDGKPFKSPVYYGVRVAHWPQAATLGAMLDFTHAKAISRFADTAEFQGTLNGAPAPGRARIGEIFRHLEFSHGHNMLTLNGLYRLPRLGAKLVPYVGLGAGIAVPHTEIAFAGDQRRTYEYQYAGPAGQVLAGVEIRLPRMAYFIEYKFTLAAYEAPLTQEEGWLAVTDLWRQARRWLAGLPPAGGYARTILASHQMIAGAGVRIVQPATVVGP